MSEQATYTEHIYQEYSCGSFVDPLHQREEIVRCRDCKYCKSRVGILPPTVCERWGYHNFKTEPERFCAWGERREQ